MELKLYLSQMCCLLQVLLIEPYGIEMWNFFSKLNESDGF